MFMIVSSLFSSNISIMANMSNKDQILELSIREIVNVPEGFPCFLCSTTEGTKCLWNKIKPFFETGKTVLEMQQNGAQVLHDEAHRVARFACYKQYIYTVSSWIPGKGCIQIPTYIETSIKLEFPGQEMQTMINRSYL